MENDTDADADLARRLAQEWASEEDRNRAREEADALFALTLSASEDAAEAERLQAEMARDERIAQETPSVERQQGLGEDIQLDATQASSHDTKRPPSSSKVDGKSDAGGEGEASRWRVPQEAASAGIEGQSREGSARGTRGPEVGDRPVLTGCKAEIEGPPSKDAVNQGPEVVDLCDTDDDETTGCDTPPQQDAGPSARRDSHSPRLAADGKGGVDQGGGGRSERALEKEASQAGEQDAAGLGGKGGKATESQADKSSRGYWRPVDQCDKTGGIISTFDSIAAAAQAVNCRWEDMKAAAENGREFKGFFWRFTGQKVRSSVKSRALGSCVPVKSRALGSCVPTRRELEGIGAGGGADAGGQRPVELVERKSGQVLFSFISSKEAAENLGDGASCEAVSSAAQLQEAYKCQDDRFWRFGEQAHNEEAQDVVSAAGGWSAGAGGGESSGSGAGGAAVGGEAAPNIAPFQGAGDGLAVGGCTPPDTGGLYVMCSGDGLAATGTLKRSRPDERDRVEGHTPDERDRVEGHTAIRASVQRKRAPISIGAGILAQDRASDCEGGQGPGDAEGRLPKRGRGGVGAPSASGRRSPVICAEDYLMQGCVTRASKQREEAHQAYKCDVLERTARSWHAFDPTRATHFTVPHEGEAEKLDESLSIILRITKILLEKCWGDGTDGRIRLVERGVENGYTEETQFVGDPSQYTVIGENPESREHKTKADVANVLLNTSKPEYKAYLNVYLEDKGVRDEVLDEVLGMIYSFPDDDGGASKPTLPGGLEKKDKGSFCQIFWNPNLKTCSGTHWDENDSLLCMLEGRKTVELAPKAAPLAIWPRTKEGEKYFSKMRPTQVEQSDTIELRPGEALFLPTGVWHRGARL